MNIKINYPFRLGTTSYILHDKKNNLLKNVHYLKNKFKLIQLLFFGKEFLDDFLLKKTIDELKEIKEKSAIEYVIHLPLDLYLLEKKEGKCAASFKAFERIIINTKELNVDKYVLHMDREDRSINFNNEEIENFTRVLKRIKDFAEPKKILIESVAYDISFFKEPVKNYNFSVCLDMPHAFIYKYNFKNIAETYRDRIKLLHFYGFKNDGSHRSLRVMNDDDLTDMISYLSGVSTDSILEVFSKRDLKSSLRILNKKSKEIK